MAEPIEKRMLTGFVAASILVVFVAVVAVRNISRSMQGSDWVNHTHAVIIEADTIVSSMHAGDAALKGFLITGDPREQVAYREAYSEMVEHLAVTRGLLKQDTNAIPILDELETLVNKRVDLARSLANAPRSAVDGSLKALLLGEDELTVPLKIRERTTQLKEREKLLLQERDRTAYQQAQTTRWTVTLAVVMNVMLVSAVFWLVRDDIAARRLVTATLQTMNQELEERVRQRTQELATANEALTVENLERSWTNQALEHQLRYSQLIINTISDPILVVTHTMNVVRINSAVSTSTGIAEKKIIGRPLGQMLRAVEPAHESDKPADGPAFITATMRYQRELHDASAQWLGADGVWRPVRVSAWPMRDSDKVVGAVLAVSPDHTAAKAS